MKTDEFCAGWYPRDAEEQESLSEGHPLRTQAYTFPTPALDRAVDISLERVAMGAPCTGFVGPPRFGKTRSVQYVCEQLKGSGLPVHVVKLICARQSSRSASVVAEWINERTGGAPRRSRKAVDPVSMVATRWANSVLSAQGRRLVLVCDELGRFDVDALTTLADITNCVEERGIKTTTLLFGSPEVQSLQSSLLQSGRTDLVGRFFARLHSYDGIRTLDEVRTVMECYDDPEVAEYPPDTGCSFWQFYMPEAHAQGVKFADYAGELWEPFIAHGRKGRRIEVGAEYIFQSIEWVLSKSMSVTAKKIEPEAWSKAVKESGFIDTLIHTHLRPRTAP
jgi:hypothetical protein